MRASVDEARDKGSRRSQIGLVAVLLVATGLRLVALGQLPPGPSYDELQNARLTERILAGQWAIYFPENFGQEPLYPTLTAAAVHALGWSIISLRVTGALAGILSVIALYLVTKQLVNRRTALLASAFHAVSFWPLIQTRVGLETSLVPPLSGLAVFFLARGLGEEASRSGRTLLNFASAGLFLGGLVYAYTAGRVMPFLPLGLGAYLLLSDRMLLRRHWPGLLVCCAVVIVVAGPLMVFLRANPVAEVRLDQLAGPLIALRQGNPVPILEIGAGTLGMFTFRGEPQWLYNIAERPVFDPVTSAVFYVGVLWCLAHVRDWRYGLIIVWFLVGLSPGLVSPPAASFTHTLAAQPAVYALLGFGVDRIWRWLSCRNPWSGSAMASVLLTLNLALAYRAYFVVWPAAPEVRQLYQRGVTAVAQELEATEPPGPVAVGAPYVGYWHPWNAVGFELALHREDLAVRWFDPASGWIWPSGAGPSTFFFPVDPLGPQEFDASLQAVFTADAVPLSPSGDDFEAYQVGDLGAFERALRAASSITMAWPPEESNVPEPSLPLTFDGRFELLGAELPDGSFEAGEEIRLTTYWRVTRADSTPVVSFVHVTSDGQDIWGQHDGLAVRPSSLQVGDRFAQVHRIPIKPETPGATYHLQLGMYRPDTLTRLPIKAEEDRTVDRVWMGSVEVTTP